METMSYDIIIAESVEKM